MLINDPHSDRKIDVTGWDLDYLAEQVTNVRQDLMLEAERELTEDEKIALDYPVEHPVWTDDPRSELDERTTYWGAIYDEAIYQRDLHVALVKLGKELTLTMREQAAYDRYVRELDESPA
jgi:hypothetical protein